MSRYSCRYCWKFFSDEKSLNIHLYESHKYCKKCKQDFENRSKILNHLEEKHKLNLICRDCNFTSFDETAVKIHLRHVHGKISISLQNPNVEKRFVSDRKSKKRCFDFSNYLAETETAISEESEEIVKDIQVNINKKNDTMGSSSELLRKMQNDTSQETFSLNVRPGPSGANSSSSSDQGVSVKVLKEPTEEERRYNCDICADTFKRKQDLEKHKIVHNTTLKYCCDLCGRKFKRHSDLKQHVNNYHNKNTFSTAQYQHKCAYCGKSYQSEADLQKHNAVCLTVYYNRSLYNRHDNDLSTEISTEDMLSYYCKICNESFSSEKGLKQHQSMIHKNSNKIKEEVKSFSINNINKGKLKMESHLQRHNTFFQDEMISGDTQKQEAKSSKETAEPLKCNKCNFTTTYKQSLDYHKRNSVCKKPSEESTRLKCRVCNFATFNTLSLASQQKK